MKSTTPSHTVDRGALLASTTNHSNEPSSLVTTEGKSGTTTRTDGEDGGGPGSVGKINAEDGPDEPNKVKEKPERNDLINRTTNTTKAHVTKAAKSSWDTVCKNYKAMHGEPSSDPADQLEARNRFSHVATPILRMISELTGLTSITLIGGARPVASNGEEADCLVASVHYGATVERPPRNFAEFDEESFRRNFVGSFEKYINCTEATYVPGANPSAHNNYEEGVAVENTAVSERAGLLIHPDEGRLSEDGNPERSTSGSSGDDISEAVEHGAQKEDEQGEHAVNIIPPTVALDAAAQANNSSLSGPSITNTLHDNSRNAPPANGCGADARTFDLQADWPVWMTRQYSLFLAEEMSDTCHALWGTIIQRWVELERQFGFKGTNTKFSAKNRPHAISDWIKSGRRCRMQLKDRFSAEYGTQWVAWWDSLNPQWRKRENGVLLQQGEGPWYTMLHAGSNGYVNILAGLVGYYQVAGDEEWLSSARDVAWVLQHTIAHAKTVKAILPHGSAGVSSQLSQKRRADFTLNDKDPRRKRRV